MSKVIIIPREGLRVKDPKTLLPVPATGLKVSLDRYWKRRLNAGDVTVFVGEEAQKTENFKNEEVDNDN